MRIMTEDDERRLFDSLLYMADTLVSGIDAIDVADRLVVTCQELLTVDAAGIMVDDQRGGLRVLASTSETMRMLELLQLQARGGPCLEAFQTGKVVQVPDLREAVDKWPAFAAQALSEGFQAAFAFPMQLRDRTIGSVNLLANETGDLSDTDRQITLVLTAMATIGLLNHRAIRAQEVLAEQLQSALNSRIAIEQAKGVIAEREGVGMDKAFELLRHAARSTRRPIAEVAADLTSGKLVGEDMARRRNVSDRDAP